MIFRASWVLTPTGILEDGVVVVEDTEIVQVRPARPGDPPPRPGGLCPGLVNAHTHLELSWLSGHTSSTRRGFVDWLQRHLNAKSADPGATVKEAAVRSAAAELVTSGVAAICDVSNTGETLEAIATAGLQGVVQQEFLSFSEGRLPYLLQEVERVEGITRGVWLRPSPHAVYSTAPQLIRAAARPGPVPATIHLAEDPDERTFVEQGTGPFAALLDMLGVDWSWWDPVGISPTAYLDALGVLGPELLLVHGVDLDERDRSLIADRGASLCLCPRSNLFISGRLPDVPALRAAGIPLCVGTDSLASIDGDLDLFADLRTLAAAYPEIPIEDWLRMATEGGADALRLPLGRLSPGTRPGILYIDAPLEEALTADRTWLLEAARVG